MFMNVKTVATMNFGMHGPCPTTSKLDLAEWEYTFKRSVQQETVLQTGRRRDSKGNRLFDLPLVGHLVPLFLRQGHHLVDPT